MTSFYLIKLNFMNTFEALLEIKTGRKNLCLRAVYIRNSKKKWKWTYYIYFYDLINHSYYINGLSKNKVVTKRVLKEIINRAFKRDFAIKNLNHYTRRIVKKTPKVFFFYSSKDEAFICIDSVELEVVRNANLEIQELNIKNLKSYS